MLCTGEFTPHALSFSTTPFLFLSEVCLLQLDEGPCLEDVPRFYYNTLTQDCEEFSYGGCEGNFNNFKSYVECRKTCYSIPST